MAASKREERRLLTRLCEVHGYAVLEMPSPRDRTLTAWRRRGRRMTYSEAVVVRLAAPERSWLAAEMRTRRAARARKKKPGRSTPRVRSRSR